MQIGCSAPTSGPLIEPDSLLRIATEAEALGFDYVTVSDHVMIPTSIASRYPTVNAYVLHAIYFATSLVAGVAASKLVEIPCLKLRERLFPRTVDGESSRLTSMLPVSEPQLS